MLEYLVITARDRPKQLINAAFFFTKRFISCSLCFNYGMILFVRCTEKEFLDKSRFYQFQHHFTDDEVQGAYDAFGSNTEVELIQVIRGTNWYGLKVIKDQKPGEEKRTIMPAPYPVDRGLYLPISETECLLWTQGSVMGVNVQRSNQPVFKEAALKPLPNPIILRRFSGEGGWHDTCSSVSW